MSNRCSWQDKMANRPMGYGLTGEIKRKIAQKYDTEQEQEARLWMEDVLERPLEEAADPSEPLGIDKFYLALKDGVALCDLVNKIKPGIIRKINKSKIAFKMMENIGFYLEACTTLGVNKVDLFQTTDLYDKCNMLQVVNGIYALGRKAQAIGFDGPTLGVKESKANKRQFTQQQLNAGQSVIGLQMGSNKGASQAGMSFGRSRSINEHGATVTKQTSVDQNGTESNGRVSQTMEPQQHYEEEPEERREFGQEETREDYRQPEDTSEDYGQQEETREDYGQPEDTREEYGQQEEAREEYGQQEEAREEYGQQEEAREEYGQQEEVRDDYEQPEDVREHGQPVEVYTPEEQYGHEEMMD